mmetsp:Transcript_28263/g.89865  ORF Transcript_28263/g.89865 Transcript_28263/m.89865 type:complete len:225 (+) Transcript_28263:559-1233(+)
MVAMPSRAEMHCFITATLTGAGDLLWSSAEMQMRMIHAHNTMGLCQSRSWRSRPLTSTGVSIPLFSSFSRSGESRAACAIKSMDAKPNFATCWRSSAHFLSFSSQATSMEVFARASNTLPRAEIRNAHHLDNVRDTYNARQNGTKELICVASASRGFTSRVISEDMLFILARRLMLQVKRNTPNMMITFTMAVLSIVKTVPRLRHVRTALYFTRFFMSYRKIFM